MSEGPVSFSDPLRMRRRIVASLLVMFAVWPLLHFQLVRRYEASAWKLFGWAMYTRPRYVPSVHVYRFDERLGRRELSLTGREFAPAEAERRRFIEWAEALGRLVKPDRLARVVQAALPARSETLEIVVLRFRIDANSSRVAVARESYFYPAEGTDEVRTNETDGDQR